MSQVPVGGSGTAADPTIFQYLDLARARIRGTELRGEWQMTLAWALTGGSVWLRGTQDQRGASAPLNTVEPQRTVLDLRYRTDSLALSATAQHSRAKPADRINAIATATGGTTPACASPPSTVLDRGASWKPRPMLILTANLNNVFDATHWRWSDVRGLEASSAVKNAYTAPGRNLQVSARLDF